VQARDVAALGHEGDRDLAGLSSVHHGRDGYPHHGVPAGEARVLPPLDGADFLPFKILPAPDEAGRGRLGEDNRLGARGRQLLQGRLIAVIALVLRDDDEIGSGQLAERLDAGGLLVG